MSRRRKKVVEKLESVTGTSFNLACSALAAAAILFSAWALTREWDKPLLDLHSFRQTQTAISTYYMVGNPGVFFDYTTPILGKPWAIPLEVPFYQWLVARWHELTRMGLDQSGKVVSVAFLFACIWPLWILLATLEIPAAMRWLGIAIFLSMPLHLYWGRSFLIETLGLFLSLSMVTCIFAGYRGKDWRWLALGFLLGVLAALCKITTWAVACGVAGLLLLFSDGIPKRSNLVWLVAVGFLTVLPIVPGKIWLKHSDAVKLENPFASQMLNSGTVKQAAWTFGTLEQKISLQTWEQIGHHIGDQLTVKVPIMGHLLIPFILVAGAVANLSRLPIILIFFIGFAAGPLVFTNLYFEHNYYWVANGVWLVLAVTVAISSFAGLPQEKGWPKFLALIAVLAMMASGFSTWHSKFLPVLKNVPSMEKLQELWTFPIQKVVSDKQTFLLLGQNWNPNAHYYAERKGISFPTSDQLFEFDGKELHRSLSYLDENEKLGAVVISQAFLTEQNRPYFSNLLQKLGMRSEGFPSPFGVVFPATDSESP